MLTVVPIVNKRAVTKLPQPPAALYVIIAGCLWGSMGVFVRRLNDQGFTSMQICEIRALEAAVIMLGLLLVYNRSLLRVRWRDLWCFLGTGLVSVAFFNYCYFSSIALTSLSVAAVMLYTAPIFVMLLSVLLFGERLTRVKLIALALAFGGCVLVSGVLAETAVLNTRGVLLGLGSGVGYAMYSIFSRAAINRGYHSLTIITYTFAFGAVFLALLTDPAAIGAAMIGGGSQLLLFSLLFAIVTTVLPYIFYTAGLSRMENSRASVTASVEPVMATLLGFFFFDEVPTAGGFAGMALVIAALTLLSLRSGPPAGQKGSAPAMAEGGAQEK